MFQFDSFAEFIAMGKHGPYVWSAVGLFVVVVAACLVSIKWQKWRLLASEKRIRAREELRR
ncbi:heme exporter protein CcmD [Salinibius halmophilus]|uniref:heme exporter protein CcmD n=1 Tax=Salinibius halmophilus TaxID=1853216 RepID=UPI000E66A22A|nr:heme exporter protein CcmD [Salinibius halmophilus]